MSAFARIVARPDEGANTLLILGVARGIFEPGVVYEITEVLGELVIRRVGPAAVEPRFWLQRVDQLLDSADGAHLLVAEERTDARLVSGVGEWHAA